MATQRTLNSFRIIQPLRRPFVIARGMRTEQALLRVRLEQDGHIGLGESAGLAYAGETPEIMASQIERYRVQIEDGISREALLELMPAGGARAAVDGALWDLEAKLTGQRAWQLAGFAEAPKPVTTAFTISLDTPEAMAAQAREEAWRPLLKVKLGANDGGDITRATAVRMAAPNAKLVADGNGGFDRESFDPVARALSGLDYKLFEQPLPPGKDDVLDNYTSPTPLCADESFATARELPDVVRRYQFANIKLDKCGGLTAGLQLARQLHDAGLGLFVGTMLAGHLSICPALLLAQSATFADLDGPLWIVDDNAPDLSGENGTLVPPGPEIWG